MDSLVERQKAAAERAGHTEKDDGQTAATSAAEQSRKRQTELEKATNQNKLHSTRSKIRLNVGAAFQRWRRLRELA